MIAPVKTDLFEFYFDLVRKISGWVTTFIPNAGARNAPVLGKYRREAINTPMTNERTPIRSAFTKSAEYYAEMHRAAVSLYDHSPVRGDAELIYACQVHAHWGLIYAGEMAIPYALEMLKSSIPEAREDAASILGTIGKDDTVVDNLLASVESEKHTAARDSLIGALGELKNKKAIPALASIIKDQTLDNDTRYMAADSLGSIVRRRFDKEQDPLAAAIAWLEKHSDQY